MIVIVPFRRSPEAAKGWLLLIFFEPTAGLLLYLLIGRPSLPAWRMQRSAEFDRLSEPTRERLLRHPNIFHPDLGAGTGSLRAPGGEPGRTPHSWRQCCRRHRRLRRHDRSSHRGHRRRARSRASALLHHRRRRDGGTRRRCARPRGRPRSCVPRASGLAGVASCFRPTAAAIAQAGHPCRGDDARRAVPPQDWPHRPAQPSQDRGHRQRHRLYRFAESRGFDVQAGTRLRGTQRPPRGPDRARTAGGLRRRLVPGDRRVSRTTPAIFRSRASPAASPHRRCRAVRAIRAKTTSA